jgi:hypothetical protein
MEVVEGWSRKQRMIWEWIIDNQFVLETACDLKNVKIVVYDDLCRAPLQGAKEIFEHLHLGWDSQTEGFLEDGRQKRRNAYFSVYKDPAVTADAWRKQLSAADQKLVIETVKDTLPARLFPDLLAFE